MSQAIGELYKTLELEVSALSIEKAHKEALMKMLQKECKHNWVDAPDLFNHHKNEKFQRCTWCKSTF